MGRLSNENLGTINLVYSRNNLGKISSITLNQGNISKVIANNINYQPFGGIASLTWGNGLSLSRSYDLDGQLSQQKIATISTQYRYDPAGNITQIADSQLGTANYQYDDWSRLIKEDGTYATEYGYDLAGNRSSKKNATTKNQVFRFVGGNRLYDSGSFLYSTDEMSNILYFGDSTIRYQYDERNRFSGVIKVNGKVTTQLANYIHNAAGERVVKVKPDSSISTYHYNQQGQLNKETQYNSNRQKTKEIYWVWVETMPVAQIEIPFTNGVAGSQQISYLHTDHLNTPRWASDSNKQKIWSWQSDAYGATLANEDPLSKGIKTTIPLRFPGQYFDQETGLHYNYYRTYHPDLGRYTQADPIGLEGGWNLFTYVGGNPIKFKDLNGLSALDVIKIQQSLFDTELYLTEKGLRIPSRGEGINLNNSFPGTLDCMEQNLFAANVLRFLVDNLDDNWAFDLRSGQSHVWGIAISSNKNDPVIYFDIRSGQVSFNVRCNTCTGWFGDAWDAWRWGPQPQAIRPGPGKISRDKSFRPYSYYTDKQPIIYINDIFLQ